MNGNILGRLLISAASLVILSASWGVAIGAGCQYFNFYYESQSGKNVYGYKVMVGPNHNYGPLFEISPASASYNVASPGNRVWIYAYQLNSQGKLANMLGGCKYTMPGGNLRDAQGSGVNCSNNSGALTIQYDKGVCKVGLSSSVNL